MELSNVKGIIFDYGGTIDTRGDHWSHVIDAGWHNAGINVDIETFRTCYVHAERELARERYILPGDNFYVLLHKKMRIELQKLAELGAINAEAIEPKAKEIAEWCYEYARTCVNEASSVIEKLAERFPLQLVSNFYGNVDEVLRDFDIRKYFNGIIESAVVGVRKPDARIFMLGCVALGLKPEDVLVVGDSLKKDILPARSIGCQTAWIKGRGWTADEDAATDPAQIPALSALLKL
jgi:putative hydrolase of the HAD superfamily